MAASAEHARQRLDLLRCSSGPSVGRSARNRASTCRGYEYSSRAALMAMGFAMQVLDVLILPMAIMGERQPAQLQ